MTTDYQEGVALTAPNSSGTEPPKLKAPVNSADCHIHIYDPRFQPLVDRVANGAVRVCGISNARRHQTQPSTRSGWMSLVCRIGK